MAIDKQYILDEIRRLAKASGGKPPGQNEFKNATGINKGDWFPHHWVRWGDALEEVGFPRNKFQEGFTREFLLEKLIGLIRQNKLEGKLRFPVEGEMLAEKKKSPDFPNAKTFHQRFGGKIQTAKAMLEYCRGRDGFEDVIKACEEVVTGGQVPSSKEKEVTVQGVLGEVYLIKVRPILQDRENECGWKKTLRIGDPASRKSGHCPCDQDR
jgi:predicted Rdx family selenoprotein